MKTILLTSFFSLLLFFYPQEKKETKGNWELEFNKNGVTIYTRDVPGESIKEFKAVTIVNANTAELEKIMKDIGSYKNWMSDVKSAKTLKMISANERIEYLRIAAPWPFDDRDVVNHFKIERNTTNNSFKVVVTNRHSYIAEKSGVVRIKKSKGFWEFTPQSNGRTFVHYQFLGDPGGEAPDWAANMFIVDGPYATLSKLKAMTK